MNENNLEAFTQCKLHYTPPSVCHSVSLGGNHARCEGSQKGKFFQHLKLPVLHVPHGRDYQGSYSKVCNTSETKSIPKLVTCCKSASLIAMKLLRYEMDTVLNVMKKTKGSFMFHLIRDPRAIIYSFIKKRELGVPSERKSFLARLQSHAKKVCSFMLLNLNVLQSVEASLDSRIRLISYEDFATNPLEFTKSLYQTLSMDLPEEVGAWIKQATSHKKDTGKFLRSNSSKIASHWKTHLLVEHLAIIDKECLDLYKLIQIHKNED